MNQVTVSQAKYMELLNLFPKDWQEKLRLYTAEELFYVYKLCKFKPSLQFEKGLCQAHGIAYCKKCAMFKSSDLTYAGIRVKLLRYLKGELNEWKQPLKPVPIPASLGKLGRRFSGEWSEELLNEPVVMADLEAIDKLKQSWNTKRVA
jgi:hypothetical protein